MLAQGAGVAPVGGAAWELKRSRWETWARDPPSFPLPRRIAGGNQCPGPDGAEAPTDVAHAEGPIPATSCPRFLSGK